MNRTRLRYDGLPRDALVNRADIAYIAGVTIDTVQSWVTLGFPEPSRRPGGGPIYLYEIGPVTDWLCATGRLSCGLTDHMLSRAEIADRLGVSTETINAWRRNGRFPEPDLRVGRTALWSEATVTAWQEADA